MRKTVKQLYLEHKGKISDTWSSYLNEWDRLFVPYRDRPLRLLEIGVQNGGSLEIWGAVFSKAVKIVGCDIDPECRKLRYKDSRVTVVVGDADTDDCERRIREQARNFDIIIDDGSHKSSDIIRAFVRYFPHLRAGGIYVAEDLHASYWRDFEGGLHNPLSAMAFFKRLADIVNYEHWRNNKSRRSLLAGIATGLGIEFDDLTLARIHSIEFANSLCIIRKSDRESNVLGKRIIVGTDEPVTSGWRKFSGAVIQDWAMAIQNDSNLDEFALAAQLADILNSRAWKIVQMLRRIRAKLIPR